MNAVLDAWLARRKARAGKQPVCAGSAGQGDSILILRHGQCEPPPTTGYVKTAMTRQRKQWQSLKDAGCQKS